MTAPTAEIDVLPRVFVSFATETSYFPLCTAERCQEISQGYAFFAYPLEQLNNVSNENRTRKGWEVWDSG